MEGSIYADRCVVCGEIIPEGRMICKQCEAKNQIKNIDSLRPNDVVNHPSHYTVGKLECIKGIEIMTENRKGFEAYCIGNITKYLWRAQFKNGEEDVKKARWYMDRLLNRRGINECRNTDI